MNLDHQDRKGIRILGSNPFYKEQSSLKFSVGSYPIAFPKYPKNFVRFMGLGTMNGNKADQGAELIVLLLPWSQSGAFLKKNCKLPGISYVFYLFNKRPYTFFL